MNHVLKSLFWIVLYGVILLPGADVSFAKPVSLAFLENFTGNDPITPLRLQEGLSVFFEAFPAARMKLKVTPVDVKSSITETVSAVLEQKKQGVRIVLGVSKSNQALAAARVAEQEKIVFITPLATHDDITRDRKFSFQICFSDSKQARVLVEYLTSQNLGKKVLILQNEDLAYSSGLAKHFLDAIPATLLTKVLSYNDKGRHLSDIRLFIEQWKPDIVFVPDYAVGIARLLQELKDLQSKPLFLGTDGWGGKDIINAFLKGEMSIKSFYTHHWSPQIISPGNQSFLKAFKKVFPGREPGIGQALMFDAMKVLWEALRSIREPTSEKIAQSLRALKYDLTTGHTGFNLSNERQIMDRPVVIHRLDGAKTSVIGAVYEGAFKVGRPQ